jgi:hypothetical protein
MSKLLRRSEVCCHYCAARTELKFFKALTVTGATYIVFDAIGADALVVSLRPLGSHQGTPIATKGHVASHLFNPLHGVVAV